MARSGPVIVVAVVVAAVAYHHTNNPTTGADAVPSGRYVAPTDGRLTSGYGPRSGGPHYGIDIAAPQGTPIRAVTDGTVIEAGPASGFGLWMRLRHPDGTVTVYGHMHTIDQPHGADVAAEEQIATVGSRGQSTGPHLHFEVWPGGQRAARIDPLPWLARHGVHL
ncbi:M23 family metallopeptidase [Kibdelosporangium persicum]|uniref:Murein DD-endopeptidase MepM and murein hydrolase activator NlpD, containing LysM domain n=1 Tax=Kibdelosporangium persicum TaxID=2698649 RepID=A0ABX2F3J8_9PSEU|nr:M23 family metallopeptidase [Kibdelosporangium persicum]NRN65904.1 Murein DD-endopeptidase MepM and murein hydrolase activator NlpD, containing LysM domain [Kibdelosporangium persicum]